MLTTMLGDAPTICWSCQEAVHREQFVRLDDLATIPCCKTCWEEIPPAQRLVIAQKFQNSPLSAALMDDFRELLRRSLDKDEFTFFPGRN